MTAPDPPVNVTVHTNTVRWPVDCTYLGQDHDGIHIWQIILPTRLRHPTAGHITSITCERLPPRTAIRLPLPPSAAMQDGEP
jgi:hypothetical protein